MPRSVSNDFLRLSLGESIKGFVALRSSDMPTMQGLPGVFLSEENTLRDFFISWDAYEP